MTKARTKGAKLRQKAATRAQAGFPELAPSRKRDRSGCFVERTRQQGDKEREPRETVILARLRLTGLDDTEANRRAMLYPYHGDPAGIAIRLAVADETLRAKLWQTFCGLDGADETYHRRILSLSRHAKCGKMEFLPERFKIDPDQPTDARDDDQKDRDAVNRWMMWKGYVGCLSARQRTDLDCGLYVKSDLTQGKALTNAGQAFVCALLALNDVVEYAQSR